MSFFRPEARRLIARWAETGVYVAIAGFGVWWLMTQSYMSAPWRWVLAAVVALLGLWLIRSAVVSALARGEAAAPGVVKIDERRIAYFGPHQGGIAALDDIRRIELWAADPAHWRYEAEWVLRWSDVEPALIIPVTAAGAEGLIDAFAALPGFVAERAFAALRAPEGATVTIWTRDREARRPALAQAARGDTSALNGRRGSA